MKKILSILCAVLVVTALVFTLTACGDKTEETPTTTEQASTTEPTTFEVPEIKDEPTTEETTEETTTEVETTKKPTYSYNSSSSSSNKGSSSSSKPASTTKAPSTTTASSDSSGGFVSAGKDENGNEVLVNSNGIKITIDTNSVGGELPPDNWKTDPDVIEAEKCTDFGRG